ncbi:MAG: hypothetical protein PHX68_03540, partial [Alphaproteobacteria bacterium]|nr:hypothetical protein [Alphaproteobacteria bacterium]
MTKRRLNELGRTMVEMLGTLAIAGILIVGGLTGYRHAVSKHEANKIANAGRTLAFLCSAQRQGDAGSTCANILVETGLSDAFSVHFVSDATKFQLRAANLSKEVCAQLSQSTYAFAVQTQTNADGACLENNQNQITWTFNNDLGGAAGDWSGEGGGGDDGGCAPTCRGCERCASGICVEDCPAGQACQGDGSCGAPRNCDNACNLCQRCNSATNACEDICPAGESCAIDYEATSMTYGQRVCCPSGLVSGSYCCASLNAQGQCCRADDQTKCCPSNAPLSMLNGFYQCYSCSLAEPFQTAQNPTDCEAVCPGQRYLNLANQQCIRCPINQSIGALTQAQCEKCSACIWEDKGAG